MQIKSAQVPGIDRAVGKVARDPGAVENGYRVFANHGRGTHREARRFDMHIFAGKDRDHMIEPAIKPGKRPFGGVFAGSARTRGNTSSRCPAALSFMIPCRARGARGALPAVVSRAGMPDRAVFFLKRKDRKRKRAGQLSSRSR